MTFDDVVKTTVFLTDMEDFGVVNSIYGEKFAEKRSCAFLRTGCGTAERC